MECLYERKGAVWWGSAPIVVWWRREILDFFFFFLLRGNHVEIAHKMYVCLLELSLWFSESKPKSKLLILGLGFQAAMIGDLEVKR